MASVDAMRAALERLIRTFRDRATRPADVEAACAQLSSLGRDITDAIESDLTAAKDPDSPNAA